jgi:hypothetical protein
MYKQKSGAMMRAGYNKDAESPFKNQNLPSPNPFRTEEMMNLRENIQSMKKSKLSGYVEKEKKKKYYTEVTPPEKSIAANVLSSQREKFKSGPSLINKDQKRLLNSPDALKTIQTAKGRYRDPQGFGTYLQTEYTDPRSGEKILSGPSGHPYEITIFDKKTKKMKTNPAARAMGKLDKWLGGFNQ